MDRRRFLTSGAASVALGIAGRSHESFPAVGSRPPEETERVSGITVGAENTLAPYVRPPLELSDSFDGEELGPQWRVVSVNTYVPPIWGVSWGRGRESDAVKVTLEDSRVRLTGRNDKTAGLCLYGVYGGRKRLASTWAMEVVMELPAVDYARTPVRAGITVRVSNEKGWGAYVELGRVAGPELNRSFLFHEGTYQEGWTSQPEIEAAHRVYLRIESADPERRVVRCGMKAKQENAWAWSPVLPFSQPVLWLDNLQLLIFATRHGGLRTRSKNPPPLYSEWVDEELRREGPDPTGKEVTVSFDAARLEGKAFSLREGVEYIRSEIPKVEIRPPQGERYEALVPDTLDIEERAKLAIHALTSLTDPNADYELYWIGDATRRPPVMHHDWNDDFQPEFMKGAALLRAVTGSPENHHVDERWREVILGMQGSDGVVYQPVVGRPWNYDTVWEGVGNREEHFAVPHVCGGALGAMSAWYLLDGEATWRGAGENLVRGLSRLIVDKGEYGYFPYRAIAPGQLPSPADPLPPAGTQWVFSHGWAILGLAQYYRATGSEAACTLGKKLATFLTDHGGGYAPDGAWIGFQHFASHAGALLGLTDFALATGDRELAAFCAKSYEEGKKHAVTLVGFMPEFYANPDYPTSEICEVAQMISIGCKLSAAGIHDCWEDVDRWIRNQFAENQLTRTDWIYDYAAEHYPSTVHWTLNQCPEGMAERSLGAFAGWSKGNDFWEGRMGPFMHCCTATSGPALYVIWESILEHKADTVRVNLLLNRTSPWLDVHSFIPYEGRVELRMKQTKRVLLRVPAWTGKQDVRCRVDGQLRRFQWQDQYVDLGEIDRGASASLELPIDVRTVQAKIGGTDYKLRIKGNEVVDIKPEGTVSALYERDHYWHGPVRYRKVTRYCASHALAW